MFAGSHPKVNVVVRSLPLDDPSGGVRTGETDIAIVWLPFSSDGLEVECLFTEPRIAVLPVGHPLAERESIAAADLAREPFVSVEGVDLFVDDYWTLAEYRDGPREGGVSITGFDEYFTAIRAGRAVAAMPISIARSMSWADLVTRPVHDLAPAEVALCWRSGNENPLVHAFAAAGRAAVTTPNG